MTTVVTRHVDPGRQVAFEALVRETNAAIAQFPGHLGTEVIRPGGGGEDGEYAIVFSFDTAEHQQAWENSPQRAQCYVQLARVAADVPQRRVLSGLETWFTLPWSPDEQPPARWRTAVLTAAFLWPAIILLNYLTEPLLEGVPMPVHALVSVVVLVPALEIAMPPLTRLFHSWLRPRTGPGRPARS